MEVSKITFSPQKNTQESGKLRLLRYMHECSIENPNYLKDTSPKIITTNFANATGEKLSSSTVFFSWLKNDNYIVVNYIKRGSHPRCNIRINYLHPNLPQEMLAEAPEQEKQFINNVNERLKARADNGENAHLDADGETIVVEGDKEKKAEEKKVEDEDDAICDGVYDDVYELVRKWVVDVQEMNPELLKNTTISEIARLYILATGDDATSLAAIRARIRVLIRRGILHRTMRPGNERLFDFAVIPDKEEQEEQDNAQVVQPSLEVKKDGKNISITLTINLNLGNL